MLPNVPVRLPSESLHCLDFEIRNGTSNEWRLSLASPRTPIRLFAPPESEVNSKLHFYSPFSRRKLEEYQNKRGRRKIYGSLSRLYRWLSTVRLSRVFVFCPSFSLVYPVIDFKINRYKIISSDILSKRS